MINSFIYSFIYLIRFLCEIIITLAAVKYLMPEIRKICRMIAGTEEKAQQKEAIRKILNTDLPEELEMSFSNIIEAGAKNRNNEIYRKACRKFQKIAAVYAMFFKHSAFKEEEEYRFIFKKKAEVLYREKDGFLIPYIEIPLSNRLLPVKEIVIAPKNHIDLAKKGVEYMMKEKGYEVEIRLSDISLRY
mgnify:CR=1 FL=1